MQDGLSDQRIILLATAAFLKVSQTSLCILEPLIQIAIDDMPEHDAGNNRSAPSY